MEPKFIALEPPIASDTIGREWGRSLPDFASCPEKCYLVLMTRSCENTYLQNPPRRRDRIYIHRHMPLYLQQRETATQRDHAYHLPSIISAPVQ